MEYTEFGKTQLRVYPGYVLVHGESEVPDGILIPTKAGWMRFKAAVDCGINFIDTAPAYKRRQGRT